MEGNAQAELKRVLGREEGHVGITGATRETTQFGGCYLGLKWFTHAVGW